MSVRKPRRRRYGSASDPEPEKRKAWKGRKRADLKPGYSTRHQMMKAEKRAAKRAGRN